MMYEVELNEYWSEIDITKTELNPVGGLAAAVDQESSIAYLYGGSDFHSADNGLYRFDLETEKIVKIDELPLSDQINHRMFYLTGDRLCVVSGASTDNKHNPKTIELSIHDLRTKRTERHDTGIPFRGQYSCSLDPRKNVLYLHGGFGMNDFHAIGLDTFSVREIETPEGPGRAGMASEFLPSGELFIFSGFSFQNGKSICRNEYALVDCERNEWKIHECVEPFGRSFAKSVIVKNLKKVLIFGGTHNGMEMSGSLYFYDYARNLLNIAYIQPLPGERVEPAMIYSERNNKAYIIGGLIPDGMSYRLHRNIMVLDLNKVPEEAWHGHP